MANCKVCGQPAGMFSDVHSACERKLYGGAVVGAGSEVPEVVAPVQTTVAQVTDHDKNEGPPWSYPVFKFSPTGVLIRGGKIDETWLAQQLNALGAKGWEVCGVFTSAIGQGATNEVAVVMKRLALRAPSNPTT